MENHFFALIILSLFLQMNTTRYEWSRKYNCSTARERPEFLFFTSSVIICMLPIFFYSLIWFFSTFRFPELSIRKLIILFYIKFNNFFFNFDFFITENRWNRRFRNLSHTVWKLCHINQLLPTIYNSKLCSICSPSYQNFILIFIDFFFVTIHFGEMLHKRWKVDFIFLVYW